MRRRVKRAAELGLTYRRYEVLVLGGGDIRAMLVEGGTLVIVAPYASVSVGLDAAVMNKLAAVTDCRRLLLAGRGGVGAPWITGADGSALFETAIEVPALRPLAAPPVKADRVALGAGLRGCALPASSVALVGEGRHGPAWVAAARLAGFVPGSEFFGA